VKDILKKKFLGIPMAVIAIILVAAVALGATAWFTTTLTSTGEVTVTVRPDFDYTITPTQLDFGSHSAYVGEAMSVDAWVTIENTGNQAIVGFEISATAAGTPIGVTGYGYPQYQTGIAVGELLISRL